MKKEKPIKARKWLPEHLVVTKIHLPKKKTKVKVHPNLPPEDIDVLDDKFYD